MICYREINDMVHFSAVIDSVTVVGGEEGLVLIHVKDLTEHNIYILYRDVNLKMYVVV